MEFRILGPLEAREDGAPVSLGGPKQRALLAVLLLHANEVVSTERLIEDLWQQPPERATKAVQVYASRLRKALGGKLPVSRPPGYLMELGPEQLDLTRFQRLLETARQEPEQAAERLQDALALWRGPPLAEFSSEPFADIERTRLEELRLEALEERFDAELRLGHHAAIVGELEALVAGQPLRERLRAQLMLALYRCGRQADALTIHREGRRILVEELGIEPSRALQELERAILRQDPALDLVTDIATEPRHEPEASMPRSPEHEADCPACGARNRPNLLFCGSCGARLTPPVEERRKVVTVLFCAIVGSTALGGATDPEALGALLDRCSERMRGIVESYGGSVERFVGNVVMAVFGIPAVHEDDALRACRAALEMREAFPGLGVDGRIGINTGDVVAGTEKRSATGDAVNLAARLEQAAELGKVLVGPATLELVSDAVEAEPVAPLTLEGTSEPVAACRLLSVRTEPTRRSESRFVGRERELALISEAWERACSERHCELLTVVGEAGVGKSRLVAEALLSLGARVVEGRCLPYGEGITYSPAIEVIKQLDTVPSDRAAAATIRALLGESDQGTSGEEIAWAVRKLLEQEAPLVVVFDDLQWGMGLFLDLVEGVALLSQEVPLLLVGVARPELLDRQPAWPVTVRLKPLAEEQVGELIGDRVPAAFRERIAHAAGGNPLFVLEMLAMAEQCGEVEVPPSLRTLLAARLDQLDASERRVLERAAVEGEVFHRGAVQTLTPAEAQVTPRLVALTRRELIRPDKALVAGENGFRFRHLLIRDAAYEGLPKAIRAQLHERFAGWLEQRGADLVELDELLGYHLEQACRYRRELAQPIAAELAAEARRRLTAAGRRAYLREDVPAAANLLERAAALLDPGQRDVALELDLLHSMYQSRPLPEALAHAEDAIARAVAAGDRSGELCLRLQDGIVRCHSEPAEQATGRLAALVKEALPLFETAGDEAGLHLAWFASCRVAGMRCLFDDAVVAAERAVEHARRAGQAHRAIEPLMWIGACRAYGSTTASELLAWLDEQEATGTRNAGASVQRACTLAMLGRIDEARSLLDDWRAEVADRRSGLQSAHAAGAAAELELIAGDMEAAAERCREACRQYERLGEQAWLSTHLARLAHAHCALGRLDEAEEDARRAAQLGASDDAATQMLLRQARAKILALRGEHADAERLAREAIAIADQTQMLEYQANAYCDLAEVLNLAGNTGSAREALAQAAVRYQRKEHLAGLKRTQARLADLEPAGKPV